MKANPEIQQKNLSGVLEEAEWNFSKERVPPGELVACCYWEYARESSFIRDVKRRCVEVWRKREYSNQSLSDDIDVIHSIGDPAVVFMNGLYFEQAVQYQSTDKLKPNYRPLEAPSVLTGNFPQPWQALSPEERAFRACIPTNPDVKPVVPFRRGDWHDARDIVNMCEPKKTDISDYEKARLENPGMSDVELFRRGKVGSFRHIPPSLIYGYTTERTVAAIAWAHFTNDEIAGYFRKWVHANRPSYIRAPNRKGKKLNDWRVALNRLGIMRTLHAFTFADNRFPKVLKERGEKHCYSARKLALKKFSELFPFIPKQEKPVSWVTKGRRSK